MNTVSSAAASSLNEANAEIAPSSNDRRIVRLTVFGFGAYCLFVLALKWLGFSAAGFDHAKEIYHAQELRWVYDAANPPLYTWLLHGTQQVLGVRLATVLILNNLLLFLIFLASFGLARRVFAAALPAVLAACSLMLIGQYLKFLYTMSHSLLAAIFCPLLLWVLLRIAAERRLRDYAALGVVIGLGLLSKFLFLAAVVAAVIAALCLRRTRRGLLDPRIAVTLAIAAAIFTPFVVASLDHWSRLSTIFRARSGTDQVLGFFASRGAGIWSLSTSIGEYAVALVVVTGLAILWTKRGRGAAPSDAGRRTLRPYQSDEMRFVGYAVLASLALVLAAVLIGGVSIIKPRFVHIFLYALPILAVAMVARAGAPALRRYAVLLALVGAGILGMRAGNSTPLCLNRCEDLVPFDRLAKTLAAAGFERGTILAHGVRLGGNMVVQFPQSRVDVVVDQFVPAAPPAGRRRQCLIIWQMGPYYTSNEAPAALIRVAGMAPERARAAAQSITIDWRWHGIAVVDPMRGWRTRRTTWRYILLPEGTERCR